MKLDNLSTGLDLAAYERIKTIEKQVRELRMGMTDALRCPYCEMFNIEGDDICCPTFMHALDAVLQRMEISESFEHADQIAQKVN